MLMVSHSEDETLELGTRLARCLHFGEVVALYGDLGAGKTVLSRGMARGLGIVEAVTSPTFTVVQEYRIPGQEGKFFFHLDMYRIDNEEAALAFGIEDFLFTPQAITFVEWPERIAGLLPERQVHRLTLRHTDHDARQLEISGELASRLALV